MNKPHYVIRFGNRAPVAQIKDEAFALVDRPGISSKRACELCVFADGDGECTDVSQIDIAEKLIGATCIERKDDSRYWIAVPPRPSLQHEARHDTDTRAAPEAASPSDPSGQA